jgi:hypothetical protein
VKTAQIGVLERFAGLAAAAQYRDRDGGYERRQSDQKAVLLFFGSPDSREATDAQSDQNQFAHGMSLQHAQNV